MKYCCFTCLVEKFIVKSFGIFLFCYKKGIQVAEMDLSSWNMFWLLCFGLLAILIVFGNTLTIWIFLKQKQRKRTSFLLISLSVADLLVGLLTIPLFIAAFEASSSTVSMVFSRVDVFTALASIFTLGVISLERMFAVAWPYRHRTLKLRAYICAIATPWIMAAMITVLVFTLSNVWGLLIFCPAAPLIVMCLAYYVIWKKQRSPMGNQNQLREARLAKTLFLITGASILTWLPFQILNIVLHFGVTANFLYSTLTILLVRVLQFSNSLVNVIIYPFRIPGFRKTLWRMLRCHQRFDDRAPTPARSESVVSLRRLKSSKCSTGNPNQESAL
mgnify:CR=1 FL=1